MKERLQILALSLLLVIGLPLAAMAGPAPGGADTDSDGVEDAFDNCTTVSNANQADADHDGCGDACPGFDLPEDLDNSGTVGLGDYNQLAAVWGGTADVSGCPGTPGIPEDLDCSGTVGLGDYNALSAVWGATDNGGVPGPSGITNSMRNYGTCP
jgi:hypothetical protein